jgi:HAD superfamily phosphoserine phosphatase-like hydrolase
MPELKLLLFDADGTLLSFRGKDPEDPINRFESGWDAVAMAAGIGQDWFEIRDRYYALVTADPDNTELYEEWCRVEVSRLGGKEVEAIMERLRPLPYNPGVREFFQRIKQGKGAGYTTGIVSSAMNIITDEVSQELGLDFATSTQLDIRDGVITGIPKHIPRLFGKGELVRNIAQEHDIGLEHIAFFGDHINDIPVFDIVGLPIAVCPKDEVKQEVIEAARGNVVYNLMDAIPIIKRYEET